MKKIISAKWFENEKKKRAERKTWIDFNQSSYLAIWHENYPVIIERRHNKMKSKKKRIKMIGKNSKFIDVIQSIERKLFIYVCTVFCIDLVCFTPLVRLSGVFRCCNIKLWKKVSNHWFRLCARCHMKCTWREEYMDSIFERNEIFWIKSTRWTL